MALQTDNLTVGYGNTPLIADIALHVRKGEIMTLIGANGSGKSTILKTISGYLQKLNGKIFFNGTDTDTISQKKKSEILSVMLTDRISTELMTVSPSIWYVMENMYVILILNGIQNIPSRTVTHASIMILFSMVSTMFFR